MRMHENLFFWEEPKSVVYVAVQVRAILENLHCLLHVL
ncbi:hypothetical protein APHMUC_0557 [Anaplasma phagocytophilum str. ApMUC09]|uniref:Uncharacterized protein n=1 Tax=Anaplasma phagocytophilum str. ApMUC09 TaxID=1359152 RepID=A0A0F3N856_ANAPH|nr:hypothetical protein APHMUC_0557 [Anaplasma phagocytophilum str. ApMUC09]